MYVIVCMYVKRTTAPHALTREQAATPHQSIGARRRQCRETYEKGRNPIPGQLRSRRAWGVRSASWARSVSAPAPVVMTRSCREEKWDGAGSRKGVIRLFPVSSMKKFLPEIPTHAYAKLAPFVDVFRTDFTDLIFSIDPSSYNNNKRENPVFVRRVFRFFPQKMAVSTVSPLSRNQDRSRSLVYGRGLGG